MPVIKGVCVMPPQGEMEKPAPYKQPFTCFFSVCIAHFRTTKFSSKSGSYIVFFFCLTFWASWILALRSLVIFGIFCMIFKYLFCSVLPLSLLRFQLHFCYIFWYYTADFGCSVLFFCLSTFFLFLFQFG